MAGRPAETASPLVTKNTFELRRRVMQTGHSARAVLLGWLMVFCGGFIHAQDGWKFPDFSAKEVFPTNKAEIVMKVYRSGSRVRVERSGALSTLYMPMSSKVYNLTVYPDQSRQCCSMKPEHA